MRGALELPLGDHEGLQTAQVSQDQRGLAEHEGEWERNTVEEGQKLDAQILLARCLRSTCLKAIDSIRFLTIDHIDLRLAPDTGNELLFVELNDAPSVQIFQVSLLKQHERVLPSRPSTWSIG